MAERLGYIGERNGGWSIAWFIDGEEGAAIGDYFACTGTKEPPRDSEDWSTWAADNAASQIEHEKVQGRFVFTKAKSTVAMAAIKAALKSKRPLLEWEKSALAAGWKPPKGWTGEA